MDEQHADDTTGGGRSQRRSRHHGEMRAAAAEGATARTPATGATAHPTKRALRDGPTPPSPNLTAEPLPAAGAQGPRGERLQKVLAHAGVASRRHAELLMREGRVTVNGCVVRELGTRVRPDRDDVRVDGARIHPTRRYRYVLLNKPVGPVTTVADPQGRQTVLDLLPPALRSRRLYPVGRLDRDTEGLLLLTDDGDLALRLTHPRYALPKVYEALVAGQPTPATLRQLELGIQLAGDKRPTAPARAWIIGAQGAESWIGMEIHEGRNRQVRRMLAEVGHPVRRLRRTRVGPLRLGDLAVGDWRELSAAELATLRQALETPAGES